MRWLGDAQRAQQTDLATPQPVPLEHRFLPSCQVRADAAEARGHLERPHVEIGPGLVRSR